MRNSALTCGESKLEKFQLTITEVLINSRNKSPIIPPSSEAPLSNCVHLASILRLQLFGFFFHFLEKLQELRLFLFSLGGAGTGERTKSWTAYADPFIRPGIDF